MAEHIRHPLEWAWDQAKGLGARPPERVEGEVQRAAYPTVRRITVGDLRDVLARGLDDFGAYRTYVIFLTLIYPVAGLVLARLAFGQELVPLIFPMASGFALIGPVAAVGLYEMSRRREQG